MTAAIDALRRLYAAAEDAEYIGEAVSQLAHALQAAELAHAAGASDDEVLAALLHDVGHLCAGSDAPRMGDHGAARHEDMGADHLAALGFGEGVTERVRGHVAAKRYLVGARPDYAERLSEASRITLRHQGGPMDADERAAFEASPLYDSWLRLRSWDEAAKVEGLEVPDFDAYLPLLEAHLRRHEAAAP
jgi:phosphonate degradation associated HDIG domain protein